MLAKDPLKNEEKSGVVYRVNCEECSSYYVGETPKHLMARLQEHKSADRRQDIKSHIWAHMFETGHVVDCKKAKIQAQAKSKGSILVQEAWLSKPNALNRSIDLHPSFFTLRHKLQKEEKRKILPRNNSNNGNQQTEQLDQVGEPRKEER